jgi:predicted dehydrogenase
MGHVESVDAAIPTTIWNVGVEDNAFLHLRGNGVMCDMHSSWTAWRGYGLSIEAYGDAGMAMMSYAPMFSQVIRVKRTPFSRTAERNFYLRDIVREKTRGWQVTAIDAFVEEFRDFAEMAAGKPGPFTIATAADGRRALQIAEAAYASARGTGPVPLSGARVQAVSSTV